jgi:hypothetical protein
MLCGMVVSARAQIPGQPSPAERAAAAAVQSPRQMELPAPEVTPLPTPADPAAAEPALPQPGTPPPIPPQVPTSGVSAPPLAGSANVVPSVPVLPVQKVTSSTSSSGQFVVHGPDLSTRSGFSSRCDEAAERLRRLLRDQQKWVLPIVVALKTGRDVDANEPAVKTNIGRLAHGGFHLQLTVQARPDLRAADFDSELIRILLAERILRNQNDITSKRARVLPEWLLTGTTQALTFRDRSRPSAVFAAIFKSGKIYGIEEILEADPGALDALSRTIYETSCCALVLALLDQPNAAAGFQKFLGLLATDSREDRELLNDCFPSLALSASSLNKWWSLQMASLATPGVFEHMGPTETLKTLDQALMLRYEAKTTEAPRSSRLASAKKDDVAAEETPGEEKKNRGLLGWLFGKSDKPADEEAAEAGDDKKQSEPPKPEPGKTKPEPAKEPEKKPEPKPEPPRKEEPPKPEAKKADAASKKDEPPVEEADGEKKKGSRLNPLNWFRGSEKKTDQPAAEPGTDAKSKTKSAPPAPEEKKEQASARSMDAVVRIGVSLLINPAFVDLLAFQQPRPVADQRLPLFSRRKKEEPPAEEEKKAGEKPKADTKKAKAEPAKPEPEKKEEPKSSRKKDGPKKEEEKAKADTKPAAAPAERVRTVSVSIPIEDYANILKRGDRAAILKRTADRLNALLPRANTLFRPVIIEYLAALADIAEGRTKDMDAKLDAIRARKQKAHERAKAVQDYLDFYEASESKDYSGTFDDFLDLPADIQKELPPRTDAISEYLDAVSGEFER